MAIAQFSILVCVGHRNDADIELLAHRKIGVVRCCNVQEEAISAAAERLQYYHKHTAAPNAGHIPSIPGFALAIRDRRADGSAVSSAPNRLRRAISAIEHAADVTDGPSYHTVMPSAVLLRDAPVEAAGLVAAAHAARVSVLAWTVRCLPTLANVAESADSTCRKNIVPFHMRVDVAGR